MQNSHLVATLALEYAPQGITIQVLCPNAVIDKDSQKQQQQQQEDASTSSSSSSSSSLLLPNSKVFAQNALASLGFASVTSGYWPHSLLAYRDLLLPNGLRHVAMGRKRY